MKTGNEFIYYGVCFYIIKAPDKQLRMNNGLIESPTRGGSGEYCHERNNNQFKYSLRYF